MTPDFAEGKSFHVFVVGPPTKSPTFPTYMYYFSTETKNLSFLSLTVQKQIIKVDSIETKHLSDEDFIINDCNKAVQMKTPFFLY